MAFVKLEKSTRGGFHQDAVEIRMGAHLQSKQGTSRGIYFSASERVIEQVGWKIGKGTRGTERQVCNVDIQEGVGEDAGFLLLSPSADMHNSYALGTTNDAARSYSMSISTVKLKHYVLNEVPVPTHPVEFTIDEKDHSILIQCPDWLRYDPATYVEPPKLEAPKPEVRPVPPTKAAKSGKDDDVKPLLKEIAKEFPINRKQRRAAVSAVARTLS